MAYLVYILVLYQDKNVLRKWLYYNYESFKVF